MWLMWSILLLGAVLARTVALEKHKITVAVSERKPFVVIDQSGKPKGLDVLIIEHFARKFNLHIDFIIVNASLNYIFASNKNFMEYPVALR